MKRVATVFVLVLVLVGTVLAQKQDRKVNINKNRHPNLAAAQRLCNQAIMRITAAQKANEYDLEGHAKKAKDLLDQANAELKLAAKTSNNNP